MPDAKKAYALAVQLYQELRALEDTHPNLEGSLILADQLAAEMGWEWVQRD